MGELHERAKRARDILDACGIAIGAEFAALNASQIDALLAHLDQHRVNKYGPVSTYRRPQGANISLVRSFHDLQQRRATLWSPLAS
jgi:hypothetical protein